MQKMLKSCFLMLFLAFGWAAMTQAQAVQINEDPPVTRIVDTWVSANRSEPRVDGWRVQIMASTDRVKVEQARNQFRLEYPEVSASWVQEQPYYKLRAGAFRTKQEALFFIASLNGWSGAYPTKDSNIHPRDFLEQ